MSPCPVIRTIGTADRRLCSSACSSRPDISGRRTSQTTQQGVFAVSASKKILGGLERTHLESRSGSASCATSRARPRHRRSQRPSNRVHDEAPGAARNRSETTAPSRPPPIINSPPWLSTMVLLNDNPTPKPSSLADARSAGRRMSKSGWKARSIVRDRDLNLLRVCSVLSTQRKVLLS